MDRDEERSLLRSAVGRLIPWYRAARRTLPWRNAPTPYQVWISEIMLQQTRIEAVIPYYARFLAELPDVAALAAVPEDRLLKLWEGLGYYSRARNLKKAAALVMADYGGSLPRTAVALRRLPGVGDYTAGAIASIACGEPEPAVDGNVLRVVMRLTACGEDVLSQQTKKRVTESLRAVYPSGEEAGLLTEGLMELGETLCLPNGEPSCEACPLAALCLARREGLTGVLPKRRAPKERRIEERTVLLLRSNGRYALRRRDDRGLLAGMWEFPSLSGRLEPGALREALAKEGLPSGDISSCGEAVQVFTHVEWHMLGYFVEIPAPGGDYVWETPKAIRAGYAIPTAFRAYLRQL